MSTTPMTDTQSAIKAVNDQLFAFISKGDAAGIASLYTENARVMPPDSDIIEGRQAIQAFFQGFLDSGLVGGKIQTLDVEEAGDMAWEVGIVTLDMKQGAGTMTMRAKYVVIWKRENGTWKLNVDIFNNVP